MKGKNNTKPGTPPSSAPDSALSNAPIAIGSPPAAITGEDYVRWAYRLLLGREPESPSVLRNNPFRNNRELLVQSILFSAEFQRNDGLGFKHPFESWETEALAFIHVPKTGGTTLHNLLSVHFKKSRICPERYSSLHFYSPMQLAGYDFYSGHFDYFSVRFIPRRKVRCISMFRDPVQRLISLYRFLRAHSIGEVAGTDEVMLARELGPEEFFEHSKITSSTGMNNAYLFYFGSALGDGVTIDALSWAAAIARVPLTEGQISVIETLADDGIVGQALARAVQRVGNLTAIGLTEYFEDSIELIFEELGLPGPDHPIIPAMVTDQLAASDPSFLLAPPVEMTQRLSQALKPLTRYDRVIFDAARCEFRRRRVNARAPRLTRDRVDSAES